MTINELRQSDGIVHVGEEIYKLLGELYPICRSITGNGFRQSMQIVKKHVPLTVSEVPTGTPVFDWTVPKEWNIKDAYIKNLKGERVVDFQKSNLHVVNYSTPVQKKISLQELKEHLFSIPEHPDWIPYRTSYYKESWGFCLTHRQLQAMKDTEYEVCIDSSLENGQLTYGEYFIKGATNEEVLFSCHACHPSLANDGLSGLTLSTFLAAHLSSVSLKYSYRFIFIPATIGSITWLALNESRTPQIKHGLSLACVGDKGQFTYKKSRRGDTEIDRAAVHTLKHSGRPFEIREFFPYGYDERQFCSPGFNLAVGAFSRTPHGCYPEYHTSADDLNLVQPQYLQESFSQCLSILSILENNGTYINKNPKCEPQLGKRGLYQAIGGRKDSKVAEMSMLWVLNLSDGNHSLLDIAERSGTPFDAVYEAASLLEKHDLLERAS